MALSFLKSINKYKKNYSFIPFIIKNKQDIDNIYKFYEEFFYPLINLNNNDKLGIIQSNYIDVNLLKFINFNRLNFTIYLDKYKYYQSITRWYNNQKRQDIFNKLTILFDEYQQSYNLSKKNDIIKLKFIELNKLIKPKLELLKSTYNDSIITIYINNYINIIDAF